MKKFIHDGAPFSLDAAVSRPVRSRRRSTASGQAFPATPALLGCFAIIAVFGWGPNFALALTAVVTLFLGVWLCWRPGEPAAILLIFVYQWVQASIAIFAANIRGMPIDETAQLSVSRMGEASLLSLFALLVVAAAFRFAAGPSRATVVQRAAEQAQQIPLSKLIIAYFASFIGAVIVEYVSSLDEGLRQPLRALLSFKGAVFFIVAYVGLRRGGHYRTLFLVVFGIEFLSSLGGYFSSFQTVFIYTFIAILAADVRLRAAQIVGGGVLAAVAVFLGVLWSTVKIDYREYVNGGSGQQEVTVSYSDAVSTLADMALSVDQHQLADGADRLIGRLTYVEFFGAALNHVPAVVPHTWGTIWRDALLHPLTPRILFPNKPITDSSSQTNIYTGIRVAGWKEGAQISIGYVGESYIDFGRFGMFLPLALYGAASGFLYRKVLTLRKFTGLISMGLSVPILMGGYYLNAETIKMVGNLIVTTLVIFTVHMTVGGKLRHLILGDIGRRRLVDPRRFARMAYRDAPRPSEPRI